METWHNGKQNEAFNVNTCVCGERLELWDVRDCYPFRHRAYCACAKCRERVIRGEVWHCPKGECDEHQSGYDLCLNHATLHEGYWEKDDVIGCCIDIDKREISYYLNESFVGIAFKNMSFKTKRLFPVVSMFNNQRIKMRFGDWISNGYQKVSKPQLYPIKDVDILDKDDYHEILQSKYLLRSDNIDIGVYQFDDMKDLHFIIPFKANVSSQSELKLYVQSPQHQEEVLLKIFKREHLPNYENTKHPSLRYLLDVLHVYDRKLEINNIKLV
eukprot:618895_1